MQSAKAEDVSLLTDCRPSTVSRMFVMAVPTDQNNDLLDTVAVSEAVQRPFMRFVSTMRGEQVGMQVIQRVRARLVSKRHAIVNQVRAVVLERGVVVRKGLRF